MTKIQHDAETKQNWGGPGMASDERRGYRAARRMVAATDYLELRAAETARQRAWSGPAWAVLGIGSRWSYPAKVAAKSGKTLLTGRV